MTKTVVVYHSGYGHTQRVAQFVAEGAKATLVAIDADGNITDAEWETLNAAKWPVASPFPPAPAATNCRPSNTSSLWPCNKAWCGWASLP